jgi:Rad3-related DNA helicase
LLSLPPPLPLLLLLLLLQSRSQLSGINWNNAVIIIDEAHNIQVGKVCVLSLFRYIYFYNPDGSIAHSLLLLHVLSPTTDMYLVTLYIITTRRSCAAAGTHHSLQDACNSNASFDLSGEQLLAAIQEMESAQGIVKVRLAGVQP